MHRLNICLWTLLIAMFFAEPVFACSPLPATAWFDETVSLVSANLPDQVIAVTENRSVEIRNNTDAVIYIKDRDGKLQKITGKKLSVTVTPAYSDTPESLLIQGDKYKSVYIDLKTTYNLFKDNRPADVAVPAPQQITINLLIEQKSYPMAFKVSYKLNPYYRDGSVYGSQRGCEMASIGPIFMICEVLVVVISVIGAFAWILRKIALMK